MRMGFLWDATGSLRSGAVCRVKDHCIARGFSWVASLARSICSESEYYDSLIKTYAAQRR